MDLAQIRKKLLETEEFKDDEYLQQYCELLINNIANVYDASRMHRHHIIPRSYYKYNNKEVDNSDDNLVNLLFKDHIIAHYLLYMSSSTLIQKYCNAHAVIHLSRQEHLTFDNIVEKFKEIDLEACQKLYEDFKSGLHDILSEKCKGSLNGNCKFDDIDTINEIKYLLNNSELTCSEIALIFQVPINVVKSISSGTHWSCKEDNFVSNRILEYRRVKSYNKEHRDEIEQKKIESKNKKLQKKIQEEKEYVD